MFPLLSCLFSKSRTFQRYKYICIDIYVEHSQINIYELVNVHLGIHILAVWFELFGGLSVAHRWVDGAPLCGHEGSRRDGRCWEPRHSSEGERGLGRGAPVLARATGRADPWQALACPGAFARQVPGGALSCPGTFAIAQLIQRRDTQIRLPPAALRVFPVKC